MKITSRSFWALLGVQFGGAFNDNLFKVLAALLIATWMKDAQARALVAISGAIFALPFLVFSLAAGRLADRWSKRSVIVLVKAVELPIVALLLWGMFSRSLFLMLSALFLMAAQSAFFGPSKYGILPEIVPERHLSRANGLINAGTFIAILVGTIAGGKLAGTLTLAAGVAVVMSLAGFLGSLLIDKIPAANPTQPLRWNPFSELAANWELIRRDVPLTRSILAVAYMWFMGGILQLNLLVYAQQVLGLSGDGTGILLGALMIGVALGSWIAGVLSHEKAELGLVPLGAFGMAIFILALYFTRGSFLWSAAASFMMGLSSGAYAIPLTTLIQLRSPAEVRGRILSVDHFLSFTALLLASGFLWLLGGVLKLDPAQVFRITGLVGILPALVIVAFIPQAPVRLLLFLLTNIVYRIKVIGRENLPSRGPALLVANHLSYADPFLIGGSTARWIRFLMYRELYNLPLIHPFVRFMDVIPVSNQDPPKEIARSLLRARERIKEGHVVCIFAEGTISTVAQTLGFKRGFERIVKDLEVPVVPVHLDRVWGSIFSFERGSFFWKMPRQIPYPVTVSFGSPLASGARADEVRQAVLDLGTRAFEERLNNLKPLHQFVLRQAKRMWFSPGLADTTGTRVTYGRLATGFLIMAGKLKGLLGPEKNVGILLPPGVAGVVANLALLFAGKVPVNLNYSLGRAVIDQICREAGINRILTAGKVLETLKWENDPRMLLLDQLPKPSKLGGLAAFVGYWLLPARVIERILFPDSDAKPDDLAGLLFTSGSTGVPKGVMLTHRNVHANLQGLQETYRLTVHDKIAGVLPFFHSFGFTGTLWLPLVAGCQAVYHRSPLEPLAVKKLIREERATILLGTPTFLQMWMKKFKREDLESLRFILTGAEKLQMAFGKEFMEQFGVEVLEGYGATELSPAVAASVPNTRRNTEFQMGSKLGKVGRPLPGVSVKIVDLETGRRLHDGEPGLLLVKGPNVMKGYWNQPEKTAEVIKDGWYVTGDIARLDDDGFIEITDRLSRFSKIGGEMVPHMLVEQKLAELAAEPDARFVVVSLPDEKRGERLVVLAHNLTQPLDDLWKKLEASDIPKLWIPDRRLASLVPDLPLLPTGKVDLVKAREMARTVPPRSGDEVSSFDGGDKP